MSLQHFYKISYMYSMTMTLNNLWILILKSNHGNQIVLSFRTLSANLHNKS